MEELDDDHVHENEIDKEFMKLRKRNRTKDNDNKKSS